MTTHPILAAAIAVGLTTSVAAQEGRTLDAWGHTFDVPNAPKGAETVAPARQDTYAGGRSDVPRGTYVSGPADTTAAREIPTLAATPRVIGVWGARIEVPAQ